MAEHAELIENAFVNYLKAINPYPFTADLLILAGENNTDKNDARIVAYVAHDGVGQEDSPLSGNRQCECYIELRTPFSKLTQKEVDSGVLQPLAAHKANVDALQAALLSRTLPDDLTAAIAGFTCFGIIDRQQTREQKDNYWSSGWLIKMLSCPAAF